MMKDNYKHEALIKRFQTPPVEVQGKPFWSWNGELDRDELIRQTHIMREMGFGGHFMHSRAGLITEYLGDEWFDHINAVADVSERIGIEAWLYDEDRYPSGSAGGLVTRDEKYRCKSIVNHERQRVDFTWTDNIYAAFLAKLDGNHLSYYRRFFKEDDVDALIAEADRNYSEYVGEWKILFYTKGP